MTQHESNVRSQQEHNERLREEREAYKEKIKREDEERKQQLLNAQNFGNQLSGGGISGNNKNAGKWYFYSSQSKNFGKSEFQRVSLTTQKTLELFMSEGHWQKHLRKIRTLNKKKHNLMKESLIKELGDTMKIESQGGGLAILINPINAFDFEILKTLAKQEKIKM